MTEQNAYSTTTTPRGHNPDPALPERLLQDLETLGIQPGSNLLLHSSFRSLGGYPGGGEGFLDALCAYFSDGLLLLPALSWETVNAAHPFFDQKETPSCVGYLPEAFRLRPDVYRSAHPTHSLSGFGSWADLYLSGDEHGGTPCSPRSPWGRLPEIDAWILMLGCDLTSMTTLHAIEEVAGITGRLTEEPVDITIRYQDGRERQVPLRFHSGFPSNQYWKLEEGLLEHGLMRRGRLLAADCLVLKAADLFSYSLERLRFEPRLFDAP
ncbi:MAG: AAC(3) family N-acetyltransferase [Bacillota bacterium]|nr:AAC(3) family N-acetyltransferase [Bacillota bacterium]